MTEKEKLKQIIKTALGFHDYYKVVVTEKDIDRLADKLIENGYGNVTELKVELRSKVDYIHELWEGIEDYKHRAEVAEHGVREFSVQVGCRSCPFKGRCGISCPDARNDYQDCYEAILRVSAREIKEKKQ